MWRLNPFSKNLIGVIWFLRKVKQSNNNSSEKELADGSVNKSFSVVSSKNTLKLRNSNSLFLLLIN
ncbi:hypothetical protein A0H76_406 [Hepatospora eriocheir]|uniref:Uncharacterized protein n=1 Tax=Hepatospora eriocheir TaxID=1081669 RepID=A0A1X0QB10_9MICR|nr:hypothetical protein A0H76_1606 [Hepatospora eriocheir]ORD96883.1 hypothetical protein A0H76_406 [Hepatospora eriocheir]